MSQVRTLYFISDVKNNLFYRFKKKKKTHFVFNQVLSIDDDGKVQHWVATGKACLVHNTHLSPPNAEKKKWLCSYQNLCLYRTGYLSSGVKVVDYPKFVRKFNELKYWCNVFNFNWFMWDIELFWSIFNKKEFFFYQKKLSSNKLLMSNNLTRQIGFI